MPRSLTSPLTSPLASVLRSWSVTSQQQARRNAMVAATALTRRRVELDEVTDFLAWRRGESTPRENRIADHG